MHAPAASQVRSSVPRLALYATHSGATMRWSQHPCWRARRARRRSRERDFEALNAPGRCPFRSSCGQCRGLAHRQPADATADLRRRARERALDRVAALAEVLPALVVDRVGGDHVTPCGDGVDGDELDPELLDPLDDA